MLVYYKEKKYVIISLLVIILDGLIVYYIPSYFNQLNYFYPMLTVSLIPFLYKGKNNYYYKYVFVLGIIYDLLYSNIFLFNALIFLIISKIASKILLFVKNNFLIYLLLIIINIFIYDGIVFLLVYFSNYQVIGFIDYLYKVKNSIINVLTCFIYYFIYR